MPDADKILRMTTVLQRCGLSRSTVYRMMIKGTFPQRVRISDHCSGWRESDLNRWISDPQTYSEAATGSLEPIP